MRVGIDARFYGPKQKGLGRYVQKLIENLEKVDLTNQYVIFLRKENWSAYQPTNLNFKKVLADYRWYSLPEQILMPFKIYQAKVDLMHFPHFNVPILYSGKIITTIHDMLMHKSRGKEATTLPFCTYLVKRAGYKFAFKRAVEKSVKIIVPSESTKNELINNYGIEEDKVSITYEGVNIDLFQKKINKRRVLERYNFKRKYFVYVGNAYPHKNLDRAIEAVVYVNEKLKKKVDLVIITSRGIFEKKLKKCVKKHKAQEYTKLLGYVSDEELGVLLRESVAFIYPSIDEGFGLQGLESMAAGTLVLASNISVFKEIYGKNAIYFNPLDFSSIAKAMEDVMNLDSNKRGQLIKKSQMFIKRYSWTKMAKDTLQIYKESL